MRSHEATEYYTLDRAKKHKSKTKPFPFIIAHECDKQYRDKTTGEMAVKNREYFAFDDVETFLEIRGQSSLSSDRSESDSSGPRTVTSTNASGEFTVSIREPTGRFMHAHEVIWDRYTQDKQQGRLMFDFDFDDAWYGCKPKFVHPNFQKDIEVLVVKVFQTYYQDVDCGRFIFVWLISDVDAKWSKHLIVKHAYFSDDWKTQSQVFYNLMLGLAEVDGFFKKYGCAVPTEKLFDAQVARSNATMRMLGSTKIATEKKPNPKPLKLESPLDATFFDTLVQLYRRCDVVAEQHIGQVCLRKDFLHREQDKLMNGNKFFKQAYKTLDYDVDRLQYELDTRLLDGGEINVAFRIFEHHYCSEMHVAAQTSFRVKSSKGSLITLERVNPGLCLLSERMHEAENAFLTVRADGSVYFHCFRGCDKDGKKSTRCHPPDYVEPPASHQPEDEEEPEQRPKSSMKSRVMAQMKIPVEETQIDLKAQLAARIIRASK